MRSVVVVAVFAASATVAVAAPASLCTLPAGDVGPAGPASPPARAPATSATASEASLPSDLSGLPFVQHVARSGAIIADLGTAHGLRRMVAHSNDQFMIFHVAPDGSAAVSGAVVEISPDEIAQIAGSANVTSLPEAHGFKGLFVRSGQQFQVFYETPDGQRLIPGVLWDSAGKDVTRQQVAGIPGAIPTVEVTSSQGGANAVKAVPLVEQARFGLAGSANAPRLYMLIDPQCIYSVRAMQMLRAFIDAGRVQVAVVPLSVLDYEDKGESTRAALALLSKLTDQIVSAWQARDTGNPALPDAAKRLQVNMQVAEAIGVRGTPTFVWQKADGTEGRVDGMPDSMPALVASLGSGR